MSKTIGFAINISRCLRDVVAMSSRDLEYLLYKDRVICVVFCEQSFM